MSDVGDWGFSGTACILIHVSGVLPKAFERRIAISGEMPVLPLIRLDKDCRVIPRTFAPAVTDKPSGSRHDTRTALPGCGGFFIGIRSLSPSDNRSTRHC